MSDDTSRRLDRFRALERPDGTPIDASNTPLAGSLAEDELPFRRCVHCQMDAHRSAKVCEMCGAEFDTHEQREYQRTLAADRKAQAAELKKASSEITARQQEALRQDPRPYNGIAVQTDEVELVPVRPPPAILAPIARLPEGVFIVYAVVLVAVASVLQLAGRLGWKGFLLCGLLALPAAAGIWIVRTYGEDVV
jgi:hypothetical protein